MRIALFSDIHGNRQAYEAVLQAADHAGAERIVILGDVVGYGGDPAWCLEKTRQLVEKGALAVRGNHDQALTDPHISLNEQARAALHWTRSALTSEQISFLTGLPIRARDEERLYVHGDAAAPERFHYVTDVDAADQHFSACDSRLSFCGHVHRPALYALGPGGRIISFTPHSATAIPLLPQRRWLSVMGSVGQPRDGDPAAAFGLYDTASGALSFLRAPYDVDAAAQAIRAAGLPETLATRLYRGK